MLSAVLSILDSINSVSSVNSVNHVNSVNSVNSYSAVLPPSPMVFFVNVFQDFDFCNRTFDFNEIYAGFLSTRKIISK